MLPSTKARLQTFVESYSSFLTNNSSGMPSFRNSLYFFGFKCPSERTTGAFVSPRAPWPCLHLVCLVFRLSPDTWTSKQGKDEEKRKEKWDEGGYFNPSHPLRFSTLERTSTHFSKEPVMAFEAAIKNKCFSSSSSSFFFLSGWMLWGVERLLVCKLYVREEGRRLERNIKRPRGLTGRMQGSAFFFFLFLFIHFYFASPHCFAQSLYFSTVVLWWYVFDFALLCISFSP